MENKKKKVKTEANEGIVDNNDADNEHDVKEDEDKPASDPSSSSDPVVLLASALNLLSDNPIARDLVADALNAASDNE